MKSELEYSSSLTPQNNFNLFMDIPPELQDRFTTGVITILPSGYIVEAYPNNTGINSGFVSRAVINSNQLQISLSYRAVQSTSVNFKIVLDMCIFKQG